MQVLTVWDITFTFLPRPTAQENGVLKSPDLRMLCWIQELSVHTHMMRMYVEVCELLAGVQERHTTIYY